MRQPIIRMQCESGRADAGSFLYSDLALEELNAVQDVLGPDHRILRTVSDENGQIFRVRLRDL
jgi:hypothetical protein